MRMRYLKDHKVRTRKRILERASCGLRRKGANGLGVAALMKLAGLTHGGFYSHFASRDALVEEAFATAMDNTAYRWKQLATKMPVEKRFDTIVAGYLSARHRDDQAHGCALPALAADIGRSTKKTRRTFASKLEAMIEVVALQLPDKSPELARQIATSAIATMMGSIVLARAAGRDRLSDEILQAGRMAISRQAQIEGREAREMRGADDRSTLLSNQASEISERLSRKMKKADCARG
jgi:TetR/AcrR family transcriptional regulator, transcriptional repressor for nem operon